MSGHIVLLGDSIFDNAAYVPDGPSVSDILRNRLPHDCRLTLLAVDGACVPQVSRQVERIPRDATNLVLSIGGNDALLAAGDLFTSDREPLAQSLARVGAAVDEFTLAYRDLLMLLGQTELPLTVCTVYDAIPGLSVAERAGLSVFNDAISRTAFRSGATLIDLRLVCDESSDYSEVSPIEPSAQGGAKIAAAILDAVLQTGPSCRVVI